MSRSLAVKTVAELYPPKCDPLLRDLVHALVAFKDDRGGVELRRALSVAERTSVRTRANELERWLAAGLQSDIASAVTGMLLGFNSRNMTMDEAQEVAAQWASALRDLPGWAVYRACGRFSRGEVRASELGVDRLDPGFAPSTAQVHRAATAIMAAEVAELARLEAVLKGTVIPAAPERAAAPGVTAAEAHIVDRDQAAALESGERIKRQEAEAPEVEKRMNSARRAEYERAGLKPPEPHAGIVVSLSMMLKMGFTIEEIRGEKVLVSPRKQEAGA
jgi:hypothetical protein